MQGQTHTRNSNYFDRRCDLEDPEFMNPTGELTALPQILAGKMGLDHCPLGPSGSLVLASAPLKLLGPTQSRLQNSCTLLGELIALPQILAGKMGFYHCPLGPSGSLVLACAPPKLQGPTQVRCLSIWNHLEPPLVLFRKTRCFFPCGGGQGWPG